MRVTNGNLSQAIVSQLQRRMSEQARLQREVASGQRITNPSDDPAAAARVLQLQSEKQQVQQFADNNERGTEIVKASYSAVEQLKRLSDRAGELAVLGAGVTSPDAYRAYSAEANQLIEQAVQVANTQYAGEHLLAGTRTDAPPFAAMRNGAGEIVSASYVGAADAAQFRISEGATLSPYTSGATNQQFAGFVNNLVSLRDALASQDAAAVGNAHASLATSEDDFLVALSDIGAKQTRFEADAQQNSARFTELENLTAHETDVDLPQTVVELTQAQSAYEAALQSSAKMMELSLLDFVR